MFFQELLEVVSQSFLNHFILHFPFLTRGVEGAQRFLTLKDAFRRDSKNSHHYSDCNAFLDLTLAKRRLFKRVQANPFFCFSRLVRRSICLLFHFAYPSDSSPPIHPAIRPFVHSSISPFVPSSIRPFVHSTFRPSVQRIRPSVMSGLRIVT